MDGPVRFCALLVGVLLTLAVPGSLSLDEGASEQQTADGVDASVTLSTEAYLPAGTETDEQESVDDPFVATQTDAEASLRPGDVDLVSDDVGTQIASTEDDATVQVQEADEDGTTGDTVTGAPSLAGLWTVADNAADDTYDEAWQGAEPVAGDEASTQASAQSHSSQGASGSASAQAAGHEAGASASSSDGVTATVPRATGGSSGSYSPSPYGPDGEEAVDQTDGKRASYSMYAGGSGPSSAQSAQVAPISAEAMAVAIATTVALGGAAATAGFFFIPGWRTAATRVLRATPLAFLFSRIDKDEVLEHPTRSELFESIRQAPGERVEDVRRQLGLANGTMLHHLRVLCDKDLVRRVKQGGITRLYPAGPRITPKPYLIPQRRMVLGAVAATPGLQQRQVATCVGMSERMVSYHIRQLVADDLIQVRRIGGANYCYPAKDPAELPALVQPAPSCAIASRP